MREWRAKPLNHPGAEARGMAGWEGEVVRIDVIPVPGRPEDLRHLPDEHRLAAGRQAHYPVFIREGLEPQILRERRINVPQRPGPVNRAQLLDLAAAAPSPPASLPIADPVEGQNRRLGKRRSEEGGGGMAKMVIEPIDRPGKPDPFP